MTEYPRPDHELEVLEEDQSVPPRPEEVIADAGRFDVDATEGDSLARPSTSEPSQDR